MTSLLLGLFHTKCFYGSEGSTENSLVGHVDRESQSNAMVANEHSPLLRITGDADSKDAALLPFNHRVLEKNDALSLGLGHGRYASESPSIKATESIKPWLGKMDRSSHSVLEILVRLKRRPNWQMEQNASKLCRGILRGRFF